MDVFALRDELKAEHQRYFESFVQIADERIRAEVEAALAGGLLWPHPRVGLNPAFEPGATVDELVARGRLDPLAGAIFRARKSEQDPVGKPMTLHRHQTEAIDAAAGGAKLRVDHGHGFGQEPGLHRADCGPCAASRHRQRHQGVGPVPDERPG